MKPTVALTVLALLVFEAGDVSARRRGTRKGKTPAGKAVANPTAEGKAHLKRANALAGEGNCQGAVAEYTAAYDKLGDPVVLFNRAECYRRLGDTAKAVEDYEDFLEEVPNAPNRADIEAKIAALENSGKGGRPESEPRFEPAREPAVPSPPRSSSTRSVPAPAVPEPKVEAKLAEPRIVEAPAEEGRLSRGWLWVAAGVLVAGGIAGAYFAFRPGDTMPPSTTFGNYRF